MRPSDTFCLAGLRILQVRLSKLKDCVVFLIHICCFSQRPGQLEKSSEAGFREGQEKREERPRMECCEG